MSIKVILFSFFISFLFCSSPLFAADSSVPAAKAPSKSDGKKPYMGDPAAKRGFELGYDQGVKAGKEDKKQGKKESATSRDEYKMGDKKYRSEYGSQARFVSAYQGGFVKGYKSGYNREKIDLEAAKQTKNKEKESKNNEKIEKSSKDSNSSEIKAKKADPAVTAKEVVKSPTPPKPKTSSVADDAL